MHFLVTNLGKSLSSEVVSRKFTIFEIQFLFKENKICTQKNLKSSIICSRFSGGI